MTAKRMLPRIVLVLAVAAAAGLALWNHTVTLAAGAPVPQPRVVPVTTVTRACPAPGLAGSPTAHVALAAGPGSSGAGRAVVSRLGVTGGTPLLSLTQPGVLSQAAVRAAPATKSGTTATRQSVTTVPAAGGVVIQASGSMARGLEAEQYTAGGKVAGRCNAPGTDFWFTGPGVYTARHISLYLMNVGGQPADVNVQAFTDAGPLEGSTDTGIAVAPHAMVSQSLGTMLRGARAIALHVRTSVGQVVAAVDENTGSAGSGAWLPASAPPATKILIPGLPPTSGTRQLFVAVPGTGDAHITLTAITTKGSYEPTDSGALDIPGGSVADLSLPSLAGIPGALQVSANVPVTAALMVPGGQSGAPGAFTAASGVLQEQGITAENVTGGGTASALVLSAPGRAVRVRLAEIGAGSRSGAQAAPGAQVIHIAAHHSLVQQLGRAPGSARGSAFAVIITPVPGSGPLYAGRFVIGGGKGGAVQSILPVPSALTTVPLPAARAALISAAR
jgi:Family of unknown function (DUF5719)